MTNFIKLEAILDGVHKKLSAVSCQNVLKHVIEELYGEIKEQDGISSTKLNGLHMPQPLRYWYELIGNRQDKICIQNHFAKPTELEPDSDNRINFYTENQGVCLWSTSVTGEDPPVWGRFNEPGESWILETKSLSQFLIQVCLFEYIIVASHVATAAWASKDTLDCLATSMKELRLAPWHFISSPTRFFYNRDALAMSMPNSVDDQPDDDLRYSTWIAAPGPVRSSWLKDLLRKDTWDQITIA